MDGEHENWDESHVKNRQEVSPKAFGSGCDSTVKQIILNLS
jgi:hypothetical protein